MTTLITDALTDEPADQSGLHLMDVLIGEGLDTSSNPNRRRRIPDESDDLRLGRVVRYEDRRI